MKNVNSFLQTKLYNLLKDNLSVPLYADYLPPTVNPNGYAIISWMTNSERKIFTATNSDTRFQLAIYTRDTSANPGTLCNTVADEIFSIINPATASIIDLEPDLQCVSLECIDDNKPVPLSTNNAIFINRFLTYRCNLYLKQ